MLPNNFFTWAAEERHEFLKNLLQVDCEVTFTKVDGSIRVMPCTLRKDLLPVKEINENKKQRAFNPENLSVWCLDKKELRSFKVMNVVAVKPIMETPKDAVV